MEISADEKQILEHVLISQNCCCCTVKIGLTVYCFIMMLSCIPFDPNLWKMPKLYITLQMILSLLQCICAVFGLIGFWKAKIKNLKVTKYIMMFSILINLMSVMGFVMNIVNLFGVYPGKLPESIDFTKLPIFDRVFKNPNISFQKGALISMALAAVCYIGLTIWIISIINKINGAIDQFKKQKVSLLVV